jgi:hypothetical protein
MLTEKNEANTSCLAFQSPEHLIRVEASGGRSMLISCHLTGTAHESCRNEKQVKRR